MSEQDAIITKLKRRLEREKAAKLQAEEILSAKSLELYNKHIESNESKRLLEMALWASGESIWSWHSDSDTFYFKEFSVNATEVIESHISFQDFLSRVHPDDLDNLQVNWSSHKMGFSTDVDCSYRIKKQNDYAWIRFKGRVVAFDDNAAQTIIGTLKDVTELIETEESSKLMSYAFSRSNDPMLIVNKGLRLVEANEAFCSLSNIPSQSINRFSLSKFLKLSRLELEDLQESSQLNMETKLFLTPEENVDVELSISEFKANETSSDYYIVALRDLTEKKKAERALYKLAHFDPVSKLLNRTAFKSRYEMLCKLGKYSQLAMVFIEIEGFKDISDQFGHEACDKLIAEFSSKLKDKVEHNESLCRWGNTEFCFLLKVDSSASLSSQIKALELFLTSTKLDIQGHALATTFSIGVTKIEERNLNFDQIARDTDAAMFKAKSLGKNRSQLFYEGIADEALRRLRMLNELRTALEEESLIFVLQGKYDQNRQLIGAEILCRWESSTFGQVSPGEFVPIIEQYGMESQLGLLAVKRAATYSRVLKDYGVEIPISVNISSPQIMQEGFLYDICAICEQQKVAHKNIELEITESVFMFEEKEPATILRQIQAAGFRISLDDFGTGYSSLSYLQQFQFDVVKVDRSFILELNDNERAYNLFIAIMNMCKALKTETVVEGIETEEQFKILNEAGVNKFQGFLLGRPIILDDFVKNMLH
ncbi:EAL domain-containing protein [Glaciecola sp. MH2013]|uniref:GGDEF domain-containing phosphodiesterase n=1 Tax=Glaciecola sp. MH2013 TaxID=2785524 RepID=UPI0018A114FB|nr:GGDEF domain-containing phosphodiesterase [Glaciecola sp. MH2013]MBF7072810.1 EAL domain-containing protein [Glaciecola sp. MH2013]